MLSCAADYNPNTRHTETKFKNKNRVRSLFGLGLNAKKRGGKEISKNSRSPGRTHNNTDYRRET